MQALLVLLTAAAFGAWWWTRDHYAEGESPFENLPPGVSPSPAGSSDVTASSGRKYEVSHWIPQGGKQLHVAELKGKPAWIAYWVDKVSGGRKTWASRGSSEEIAAMRKDFAL